MTTPLPLWLDLRSPYSYLAKDPAYALERDYDVALELKPYGIDIKGVASGMDAAGMQRAFRKIKYSYADVRRFAGPRGLTILGPKKVYEVGLAHAGWLWAERAGRLRPYLDVMYPKFFERRIDIEATADVAAALREAGIASDGFDAFARDEAPALLAALNVEAEAAGAFGVPSFMLDGELFWGHDRMELLEAKLAAKGLKR